MMMRAKVTLDLDNATIESVSNRLANQLMALAGTSFVLLFLVLAFFALNWILSLFMSVLFPLNSRHRSGPHNGCIIWSLHSVAPSPEPRERNQVPVKNYRGISGDHFCSRGSV